MLHVAVLPARAKLRIAFHAHILASSSAALRPSRASAPNWKHGVSKVRPHAYPNNGGQGTGGRRRRRGRQRPSVIRNLRPNFRRLAEWARHDNFPGDTHGDSSSQWEGTCGRGLLHRECSVHRGTVPPCMSSRKWVRSALRSMLLAKSGVSTRLCASKANGSPCLSRNV
jgi:hypothetical protein